MVAPRQDGQGDLPPLPVNGQNEGDGWLRAVEMVFPAWTNHYGTLYGGVTGASAHRSTSTPIEVRPTCTTRPVASTISPIRAGAAKSIRSQLAVTVGRRA